MENELKSIEVERKFFVERSHKESIQYKKTINRLNANQMLIDNSFELIK